MMNSDARILDPQYLRPEFLLADANKAHRELGWEPRETE